MHGLDIAQTQIYVNALRPAEFRWTSRHSAEIQARCSARSVSFQFRLRIIPAGMQRRTDRIARCRVMAWARSWPSRAATEPCTVELSYDGGMEMKIARFVSWSSSLGCLGWIVFSRRRR